MISGVVGSLFIVTEDPVVWKYDASKHAEPDHVDVDALARLQLAAKRRGARLELYGACPQLVDLLQLAGLSEILPCANPNAPGGVTPREG